MILAMLMFSQLIDGVDRRIWPEYRGSSTITNGDR